MNETVEDILLALAKFTPMEQNEIIISLLNRIKKDRQEKIKEYEANGGTLKEAYTKLEERLLK